MRITTLRGSKSVQAYPTVPGVVFVAECDAGHCFLCHPEPGDFVPILAPSVHVSTTNEYMVEMPLSMTHLHVRAAYRGQGVGARLVQACQGYARARKLPISLRALPYGHPTAKPTLKALLAFYERCGFAHAGKHGANAYMVWRPS